jgi:cysteine desulfurase/selenocysteine lyase
MGATGADEIIFVRNATEALNLVAECLPLKPGDAVLTTGMEHNSNLLPWQRLARTRKVRHVVHGLDPVRGFDSDAFLRDLTPDVRLVSVFHVSNLCGIELPVEWIAMEARKRGVMTLIDGAQAVTTHSLDVASWGVDFYAFSFHKMFGPTGIGALFGRRDVLKGMPPFRVGGDTVLDTTYERATWAPAPQRFEAGVADLDGEVGAAAAARFVRDIGPDRIRAHAVALNARATEGLIRHPRVRLVGPTDASARNGILNFHVDGLDSRSLAGLLDERANIMVRYGRHCVHSWYHATGTPETIRASFSITNTIEDADRLVRTVESVLSMIG